MAGEYDFEEQERLAALRAWWEDNRWYVLGAIAAVLLSIAGYRAWQYYQASQADDAALMYTPVAEAAKSEDPKKVAEAAKPLMEKHPGSFAASQAGLVAAKAAFDAGNLEEARQHLAWVVDKGVQEHQPVARMRLAAVLLEQKKYEEALKVLDGNKDEAFVPLAADLRGDIMLAQGRTDEARANYKLAAEKADARNPVKGLAETKLNALGGAQ